MKKQYYIHNKKSVKIKKKKNEAFVLMNNNNKAGNSKPELLSAQRAHLRSVDPAHSPRLINFSFLEK